MGEAYFTYYSQVNVEWISSRPASRIAGSRFRVISGSQCRSNPPRALQQSRKHGTPKSSNITTILSQGQSSRFVKRRASSQGVEIKNCMKDLEVSILGQSLEILALSRKSTGTCERAVHMSCFERSHPASMTICHCLMSKSGQTGPPISRAAWRCKYPEVARVALIPSISGLSFELCIAITTPCRLLQVRRARRGPSR